MASPVLNSFFRRAILLAVTCWMGIAGWNEARAVLPPTVTGTLPNVVVLQNAPNQDVNLSGVFQANDAPGTVVDMTTVVTSSNVVLNGTNHIYIALSDTATPVTVANFLSYVNAGIYNGTFIHRVENQPGFSIVQGGAFAITGATIIGAPAAASIQNEYDDGNPNEYGTIAMAKVDGQPDSATSSWFFNVSDNSYMLGPVNNEGFTVFGHVLGNGMDIVNGIAQLPTFDWSQVLGISALTELPLSDHVGGTATSPLIREFVRMVSVRTVASLSYTVASSNYNVVSPFLTGTAGASLYFAGVGTATVTITAINPDNKSVPTTFTVEVKPPSSTLVSFASTNTQVSGKGPTATLHVTRTGKAIPLTVHYSTSNGSAVAGTDYRTVNGNLTFTAKETSKTITIPIIGSNVPGPDKTFAVTLSSANPQVSVGTNAVSTVTILKGNPNPHGVIQFSHPTYFTDAGIGYARIDLTRTLGSVGLVTAVFSTTGKTAILQKDFGGLTRRIGFPDGDSAPQVILIATADLQKSTQPLTFTASLTAPEGGATLGENTTATVQLYDSLATNPSLAFSSSEYRFSGNAGKAVIGVRRLNLTTGSSTVHYSTSNGTGKPQINYTPVSGNLTFAAGESYKTFSVPIFPNAADQTVQLHLSTPSTGIALVGAVHDATLVIAAKPTSGLFSFSPANHYRVNAGDSLNLAIVRSGSTRQDSAVIIDAVDGTGVLRADYGIQGPQFVGDSGVLYFPPGTQSGNSVISAGTNIATTKTFALQLVSSSSDTAIGTPNSATVTICNPNVPAGAIEFTAPVFSTSRASGKVVLPLTRSNTSGSVSVKYSTSNGTAKAGTDYTASTGTVGFADGASSATIIIPVAKQSSTASKTFGVTLTDATHGAIIGVQDSAQVTISTTGF